MWKYIIPAISAIVVAVVEALAARDRSRAKKQAETLKRHEQQRAEETRLAMAMNSEDGKLYLCQRTGEAAGGTVVLQYMPHELVGHYFVEVSN